jgi:uncharacterized membrane protein
VKIETSVVVARPVDEVFAFIADPANLPRWQSSVVEVRPAGDGRHVEVRSFLGKQLEQTMAVVASEPGRRLDVEVVEGPLQLRISHTFSEVDGGAGTRVDFVGEADAGGVAGLAGPLLGRAVRKQAEKDLAKLKSVLERES